MGTAALLEAVVREYVRVLRYRGEVQAGLHPKVKRTEAEIATSSSLNPRWREPVITAHGAVYLSRPEIERAPDLLGGSEPPPF